DAGGAVEVLSALLVEQQRPFATVEDHGRVEEAGAVRAFQFQGLLDRRPLDLHSRVHAITVPSPVSARLTGRATRASPSTTLRAPPASASRAPISFFFMRPPACSMASSRREAHRVRTRLASFGKSRRSPGTLESRSSS